jgi:regulator of protease activity HflC (stomatin/prohibitin superfamily)
VGSPRRSATPALQECSSYRGRRKRGRCFSFKGRCFCRPVPSPRRCVGCDWQAAAQAAAAVAARQEHEQQRRVAAAAEAEETKLALQAAAEVAEAARQEQVSGDSGRDRQRG